jgi:hypothetical protein
MHAERSDSVQRVVRHTAPRAPQRGLSEPFSTRQRLIAQPESGGHGMPPLAFATLTLVVTDVQRLPLDRSVLQAATETALAGSGAEVAWDAQAPGESRPLRGDEARVILMSSHPSRRRGDRVLGAVFRERGPSRAAWVYVEDVRVVLRGGTSAPRGPAIRELSVAVGRVLAHEVVHLLAPEHPHATAGLMAGAVDRRVLAGKAPLDRACLRAIRLAVSPPAAAALAAATAPSRPGLFEFGGAGLP